MSEAFVAMLATRALKLFTSTREKAIYPLLPFLCIPGAVVSVICYEVGSPGLLTSPGAAGRLEFSSILDTTNESREVTGSLILLDAQLGPSRIEAGNGTFKGVWFPESLEVVDANGEFMSLGEEAFTIDPAWYGLGEIRVFLVEGASPRAVMPKGKESVTLRDLELFPSQATFIGLGCCLVSVFGLGYASGFSQESGRKPSEDSG